MKNENISRKYLLFFIGWTVVLGILFVVGYSLSAHAEEDAESALQFTTSAQTSDVQDSGDGGTGSDSVIVNVIPSAQVDEEYLANNAPAELKANAIGYTPTYDMTTSDTYASILYDVFLNQGNTFDDFIIFRAGDYRYFLVYGSVTDDYSFKGNVVQLDYNSSWSSGKRYTLTYSTDVEGTFRSNNYTFISNVKGAYALSPNVCFERKEQYKTRIAVYILAVMTLFSSFRFFRKSTVRSKS